MRTSAPRSRGGRCMRLATADRVRASMADHAIAPQARAVREQAGVPPAPLARSRAPWRFGPLQPQPGADDNRHDGAPVTVRDYASTREAAARRPRITSRLANRGRVASHPRERAIRAARRHGRARLHPSHPQDRESRRSPIRRPHVRERGSLPIGRRGVRPNPPAARPEPAHDRSAAPARTSVRPLRRHRHPARPRAGT